MPRISDFPARGKVIRVEGRTVVFHPAGSSYQLHLETGYNEFVAPPLDTVVDALIRVRARKLWTVPSGGLFIAPIFGQPRTIQGRVRNLDERQMVLSAGTNLVVELPVSDSAYDLSQGPIEVGRMVNVSALPGATIELLRGAPVAPVASESAAR